MFNNYEDEEYNNYDEDIEIENNNKVITFKNIVTLIISFLLCQVQFLGGFAPLGLAIFGASMANKVPLVIPFIGCSIGILIRYGVTSWLMFTISAVFFIFLTILFKKNSNDDEIQLSKVKMFLATFIVQLVPFFMGTMLIYDFVILLVLSITTVIFYIVFTYGLNVMNNIRKDMIFSIEEIIGACIMFCLAICAFGPLVILSFNICNVLCILFVLVLGWKRGITIGITTGLILGCVLVLIGIGDVSLIASYVLSGFIAGAFRKLGKIGVAIGFILGNALLIMLVNGSTEIIILLREVFLASIILLLIPKKAETNVEDILDKTSLLNDANEAEYSMENKVVYRLNTVSAVFDEMADTLGESAATIIENKKEVMQFYEDVTSKTCEGCPNFNICWKEDLYKKYNVMFSIIDVLIQKNKITNDEFKIIIEDKCIKQDAFVESLNGTYDIYKLNEEWKKSLQENRELIAKQLKSFADVISSIAKDISNKKSEEKKEKSKFKVTIGISKTSKDNNTVNGDNNIIFKLDNGKYIIGLSDGRGHGEKADKNSKLVVNMLEKFLKSGFDKETAINLINSLMLLKSEQDSIPTMDISVVDTQTANVEFVKIGACPTFIKRKDKVEFVNSISLPVGIVDKIDIDLCDKKLEDGDYIIMVTDGIIDSNKKLSEKWLKKLLEKIEIDNPQRLADIIIQESVDNSSGIAQDDMTVVVSKIKTNN